MKTFKDLDESLQEQEFMLDCIEQKQEYEFERNDREHLFFFFLFFIFSGVLLFITVQQNNQIKTLENRLEEMGDDAERSSEILSANTQDLDQMVCELKENGALNNGWVCQLYDDAD